MARTQPEAQRHVSLDQTQLLAIIQETVLATLASVGGVTAMPQQISVMETQAETILGLPPKSLASDRREHYRGAALKVPFQKFGNRILYKVTDLVAAVDRLPRHEAGAA